MVPAERAEAAPERRLVTVLFADLSGYTALCSRLDPEDVHDVVRPAMRALRSVAESFGGTVPSIQGDGFMAVFGAPLAHEDDAERAVRAAFGLLAKFSEIASRTSLNLPGVHVGINTGEVVVWTGLGLDELSIAGDAVNVASRLCGVAGAGEICVGPRTVELTQRAIDYSEPTPSQIRGIVEPVPVCRATGIRADAVAGRRAISLQSGFVGRVDVLRGLDVVLDEARRTKRARTALVLGDAGYGKSRLAMEWVGSYDDVTVLTSGCTPFDEDPLSPWSAIASGPPGADPGDPLAVESMVTRLLAFLRPLADDRPVVVIADDLHLATPESRRVLTELERRAAALPIVVVALARPEIEATDVRTFVLGPLEDAEMRELLTGVLGAPLPEATATALLHRAGGNPLFLEECAAHLVEAGHVVVSQDAIIVAPDSVEEIPNSMRQFIAARLDALPPDERTLLQEASVGGDAVWAEWLDDLESDRDARAVLGRLEQRGLVRRSSASLVARAAEFTFKHALIRDVAYESLTRRRRSAAHLSLARWLDDDARHDNDVPLGALAHHYSSAWELARTELAADGAPDCALARSAVGALGRHADALVSANPRLAAAALERAAAIVDAAPECFDDTRRAELSTCRARVRVELGDFPGAIDDASAGEQLAGELRPLTRGRALLARARALTSLSRVDAAAPVFAESIALLRAAGDLSGAAEGLRYEASNHRLADRRRFLAGLHDAHAAYEELGDLAGQREVAAELSYELTMEGGPAYRKWYGAAEAASDLDVDIRIRASLRRSAAFMAQNRGERRRAVELAALAYADAESIGAVRITVDSLICQLEATSALGLAEENVILSREASLLADRLALRRFRALALLFSARPKLLQRRPAIASQHVADARALLGEMGGSSRDADLTEVVLARDSGTWDQALALGRTSIDALERDGNGLYALPVRVDVARAMLGRDAAASVDLLAEALDAARRHDTPQHGGLAAACLEQAQLLSGQETSQRIGAAPERSVELDATMAESAALRSALRGEWAEAASSFGAAAEVWSEIGATVWLARAMTWQIEAGVRANTPASPDARDVVVQLLADLQAPAGLADSFAQQLAAATGS